jgi:hypothetical protein
LESGITALNSLTITISLVLLSILVLVFLYRIARQRAATPAILEDPATHLRSVNVDAFRNLMDPDEEDYLRERLPTADFHMIHRERMRAAVEYLACVSHNASILMIVAEAAGRSPDPAVVSSAKNLAQTAMFVRLYAFRTMPKLYLAMAFPSHSLPKLRVADDYERMTRQVVMLGLQYPMHGVSAQL